MNYLISYLQFSLILYFIIKLIYPTKSGILFRLQSFWIGIHHSKYTKRTCINLLPCITIWIGTKPTNKQP